MPGHVRVGGSWKTVSSPSVRVGGSWKSVTAGFTRVGGAWKQWYTAGGGPSIDRLGTATVSGDTTSFAAFSSIPATYKHLILTGRLVQPGGQLPQIGMFFNGITGTSYDAYNINHYGYSSISADSLLNRPNIWVSAVLGAGSSLNDATFEVEIFDYANPNKNTSVKGFQTTHSDDATHRKGVASFNGVWKNTAVVNSIGIAPGAIDGYANAVYAGSSFTLYGVKG
jgi:hypothetical protein